MFDLAARRQHLDERLDAEGIAALFLAPSADLEYLTGAPTDALEQTLEAARRNHAAGETLAT
jgi:Creatinase/Prolidase N-terminal domain